ncbi:1,2-oxophytodienoate reductase [Corynebacterium liangguodongii]|uniref:1,2-oxophytodienoate reductase n=1 Tax=Corynebacterium liangguodongii TaxID=2079535 RepID=A0A2S0WCG4_9CORY|nr:1,2-oxophytodienoate reductase [Corynebacterium liangguodongii]AWB83434.1 1,2-oxophytodienoate reductase [Corynebacterium liangguodongii]PWC00476.1 1,2-oxophytodienoate reductase [Corynebacterium liangguodongii]
MANIDVLWQPLTAGSIELSNRVVQAPMGRLRAATDGTPTPMMVQYFRDRASVGLIVTDGTSPSLAGRVQYTQPGLYDDKHIPAWREITDAVHAEGGAIVVQLMHAGWNTHTKVTGLPVEAPSAVAHEGHSRDEQGNHLPYETPEPATAEQLEKARDEFVAAARRAIEAGFDGVELHGANGYFLHTFLGKNSNVRDDEWGGTPEKRAAYPISVARAVAEEIGADRLGIRICPGMSIQGVDESDEAHGIETYTALVDALNEIGLAYISIEQENLNGTFAKLVREHFDGVIFGNATISTPETTTREDAAEMVEQGWVDAAAVARPILANPDLIARWKSGAEENVPDPATFYVGGEKGYNDYPALG